MSTARTPIAQAVSNKNLGTKRPAASTSSVTLPSCIKRRLPGSSTPAVRTVEIHDPDVVESDAEEEEKKVEVVDSSVVTPSVMSIQEAQDKYNEDTGAVPVTTVSVKDSSAAIKALQSFVKAMRTHGDLVDVLGSKDDEESLLTHLNDVHQQLNSFLHEKLEL